MTRHQCAGSLVVSVLEERVWVMWSQPALKHPMWRVLALWPARDPAVTEVRPEACVLRHGSQATSLRAT